MGHMPVTTCVAFPAHFAGRRARFLLTGKFIIPTRIDGQNLEFGSMREGGLRKAIFSTVQSKFRTNE